MNQSNFDTIGPILFLIGLLIRFWIGRRRFGRRNVAGLQVFSGYLASQITPFFEWLFNLLGLLLIVCGVASFVMC